MCLKEYFFGTESAKARRESMRSLRELSKQIGMEVPNDVAHPFSERGTNLFLGIELVLGKYIPNVATAGSLVAAAVSRDSNYLLCAAASEGLRLFFEAVNFSQHRSYHRKFVRDLRELKSYKESD
jgi:hypothetical protein